MIKVGLTGNYCSGQNEISELFEDNGVASFDADLILKYLINYSKPHMELVKTEFGEGAYSCGLLNFSKFTTNTNWNKLIDIVEFDIIKAYERFRLTHKEDFYTIFKYSYLFERKLNESMDVNISCYRPKYYRRTDMQTLTYMDLYRINYLVDNEMDELFKNKKSDFIIENYNRTGDKFSDVIIGLDSKVRNVHKAIIKKKPQDSQTTSGHKYSSGFWD